MFSMIAVGINVVVLLLLFGVMSKLEDIAQALRRMNAAPKPAPELAPPASPPPG